MFNNQQTDSEIHEDQLLNFLVDSLDEEVTFSLTENAELDTEGIYEVLVGACTDGISVSTLCRGSKDTPRESSALYHLHTKFDLKTFEQIGSMFLQKGVLSVLSQQVEVCIDLHLRPYCDDEDDTDSLYHPQAKRGTTAFRAYATLYVHVRNKRYTLAARRLGGGDTVNSVLAEFLGIPDGPDLSVKAVYLNREFHDSKCSMLLQAHNHTYVVSIVRWGRAIKRELPEGQSCVIQHSLTTKFDGHSQTIKFPVYIDCAYQDRRYNEHGVTHHGYAAGTSLIDSLRYARYRYAERFGIGASCRLSEQNIVTTSMQSPVVRLLYVVVSPLLQNIWRYLHWEYVVMPRRGGRRLQEWSFKEFISMVRRVAWTALAARRAVPANRPPYDRLHR